MEPRSKSDYASIHYILVSGSSIDYLKEVGVEVKELIEARSTFGFTIPLFKTGLHSGN